MIQLEYAKHPKVIDFLMHITTHVDVLVFHGEGDYGEKVIFEGIVMDYINRVESGEINKDLILVWSSVDNNQFVIEALEEGHELL